MIAQRSPRGYLRIVRSQSGRQDSNLRPSAPKALDLSNTKSQYFPAITSFLLSGANKFKSQPRTKYIGLYTKYIRSAPPIAPPLATWCPMPSRSNNENWVLALRVFLKDSNEL